MSFLWSFASKKVSSRLFLFDLKKKKLMYIKKEPAAPNVGQPLQPSFKAMSNAFRKGVQYNSKFI